MVHSGSWFSRPRRLSASALGGVVLLTASGIAVSAPAPAYDTGSGAVGAQRACGWRIVKTPRVGLGAAELHGVDAAGRTSVWAVGNRDAAGRTLIERWNGTRWSIVKSPNRSSFTDLRAVTVLSAKNAWAVGWYVPAGSGHQRTLIEHWNGRVWKIVPSPNPLRGNNILFGVDATSSKRVWAVGGNNLNPDVGARAIILRWNGRKWAPQKPPAGKLGLADVAVQRGTPVAVGHYGLTGTNNPAVIAYHAGRWHKVTTTAISGTGSAFNSVDAAARGPWRAVGSQSGTSALQTLGGHGRTTSWQPDPTRDSSTTQINVLNGFGSSSPTGGWAVGYHENASFTNRTLIERSVAGTWTIVPSPNPNPKDAMLDDVVRASAHDTWAVGRGTNKLNVASVLVERYHC